MTTLNLHNLNKRATILRYDTPDNLILMSELLQNIYTVKVSNSGTKALKFIDDGGNPDLIFVGYYDGRIVWGTL